MRQRERQTVTDTEKDVKGDRKTPCTMKSRDDPDPPCMRPWLAFNLRVCTVIDTGQIREIQDKTKRRPPKILIP